MQTALWTNAENIIGMGSKSITNELIDIFLFPCTLLLLAIYIWSCILHSSSHLILQFWRNRYLSLHDMSWIALLWMKVFQHFFLPFCKCLLLIYQNYYLYWFLCSASLLLLLYTSGLLSLMLYKYSVLFFLF